MQKIFLHLCRNLCPNLPVLIKVHMHYLQNEKLVFSSVCGAWLFCDFTILLEVYVFIYPYNTHSHCRSNCMKLKIYINVDYLHLGASQVTPVVKKVSENLLVLSDSLRPHGL